MEGNIMINKSLFQIFKQGSKTYFYSSIFFPSIIRKDVFVLYAFVRKIDNYVDSVPQDTYGFYKYKNLYYQGIKGKKTGDLVIDSFIQLQKRKKIKQEWVDAFLNSMENDITKKTYETLNQTIKYMHGSAEVIGFMMAKILDLNQRSYEYAKYLGRSMQYINFIRDIFDDIKLGRRYLPSTELEKYGLKSLNYDYVDKNKKSFEDFLRAQINHYLKWMRKAEEGYKFIPKRYLIPIKTASEMYFWTAMKLYNEPFLVYNRKIKPNISKIISTIVMNIIENKKINNKIRIFEKFENDKIDNYIRIMAEN
jgi:phytoene synthase